MCFHNWLSFKVIAFVFTNRQSRSLPKAHWIVFLSLFEILQCWEQALCKFRGRSQEPKELCTHKHKYIHSCNLIYEIIIWDNLQVSCKIYHETGYQYQSLASEGFTASFLIYRMCIQSLSWLKLLCLIELCMNSKKLIDKSIYFRFRGFPKMCVITSNEAEVKLIMGEFKRQQNARKNMSTVKNLYLLISSFAWKYYIKHESFIQVEIQD